MLVALSASPEALGLSKRETEVLSWVIQGKTDAEIGMILEISSRTVEKHVGRILHKLGAENRTTAASIAFAAWQSFSRFPTLPLATSAAGGATPADAVESTTSARANCFMF
jgi:DNA-binding CsgD family transcriptional regulator